MPELLVVVASRFDQNVIHPIPGSKKIGNPKLYILNREP